MSRIGRQPIEIPSGVEVVLDWPDVTVTGPRGTLTGRLDPAMRAVREGDVIRIERPSDERTHRAMHGLTRSLLANMVEGATNGFEKRLEIVGVGYRAILNGTDLELSVGYSHIVRFPAPKGIEFEVPAPNRITVRGIDKQQVGEVAATIRRVRKPEPYKGKGIRYEGEHVRKKAGKAAKGAVA